MRAASPVQPAEQCPLRGKGREYLAFPPPSSGKAYATILPLCSTKDAGVSGFVLYTVAYGFIGTHAIAATNITNTVQNLFLVLCLGIASASS